MRVTFVQYGDYGEAAHRFAEGQEETYYAQRYSVDFIARLRPGVESLAVVAMAAQPRDEILPSGVRAIGMQLWPAGRVGDVVAAADSTRPTHIILCAPLRPLVTYAERKGVRVIGLFADSFHQRGIRSRINNYRLANTLNRPNLEWAGNHNVNASLNLKRLGVVPGKIIPWDWPPQVTPGDFPVKPQCGDPGRMRLLYVGCIHQGKGVGDCIQAVRHLREHGYRARLTVVGEGPHLEKYRRLVQRLHLREAVEFKGAVPHADVIRLIHAHDAIIVASHPDYPEGLPMTIYEAYCARTPLIAANHPMFCHKIIHNETGLIFAAGDSRALAECVLRLAASPDLYLRLSQNSQQAWERIQCPVKWDEFITRWLRDGADDRLWLARHTLGAYPYY